MPPISTLRFGESRNCAMQNPGVRYCRNKKTFLRRCLSWLRRSHGGCRLKTVEEIDRLVAEAEEELARLESERQSIMDHLKDLRLQRSLSLSMHGPSKADSLLPIITNLSSPEQKVRLFLSLFRGRQDVYPRRFESKRTGKDGYQPACRNEWLKRLCGKPRIKCGNCTNRDFFPVTEEVIQNHLRGFDREDRSQRDFTIGVYPMLPDETCWFIAADFDKAQWTEDASAFLETCRSHRVPAILERSRSGNGGHIWVFFSEPIPAALARQLGSFILTPEFSTGVIRECLSV
jgi:hypothetical protein